MRTALAAFSLYSGSHCSTVDSSVAQQWPIVIFTQKQAMQRHKLPGTFTPVLITRSPAPRYGTTWSWIWRFKVQKQLCRNVFLGINCILNATTDAQNTRCVGSRGSTLDSFEFEESATLPILLSGGEETHCPSSRTQMSTIWVDSWSIWVSVDWLSRGGTKGWLNCSNFLLSLYLLLFLLCSNSSVFPNWRWQFR